MPAPSKGESLFLWHCKAKKLPPPVTEFRFTPDRRFRADFAWPKQKILVEVEGAVWSRGRHTRGSGYTKDLEKYNLATELGWRIFRYSTEQVESGEAINQIERVMNACVVSRGYADCPKCVRA